MHGWAANKQQHLSFMAQQQQRGVPAGAPLWFAPTLPEAGVTNLGYGLNAAQVAGGVQSRQLSAVQEAEVEARVSAVLKEQEHQRDKATIMQLQQQVAMHKQREADHAEHVRQDQAAAAAAAADAEQVRQAAMDQRVNERMAQLESERDHQQRAEYYTNQHDRRMPYHQQQRWAEAHRWPNTSCTEVSLPRSGTGGNLQEIQPHPLGAGSRVADTLNNNNATVRANTPQVCPVCFGSEIRCDRCMLARGAPLEWHEEQIDKINLQTAHVHYQA